MRLEQCPSHAKLQAHAKRLANTHMRELFAAQSARFDTMTIESEHVLLDYSKNILDEDCLLDLLELVKDSGLEHYRQQMFSGAKINNTEQRAVLHTALRRDTRQALMLDGVNISEEIQATKDQVYHFVSALHKGEHLGYTGKGIDTLVSIGIGGSYLGPLLVTEALAPYAKAGLACHFVANIDGTDLSQVLAQINPETTLFVIQSKSFKTQETLENAKAAKTWFMAQGAQHQDVAKHFVAVSSNVEQAQSFGINPEYVFPMWDWVGGRYSLWSAIGLPIAFMVGSDNFEALLSGAREMDEHFCQQPAAGNIPIVMGLLGIWYNNYLGADSHAVLPYDQHLAKLPGYLQQLDMESNGKSVDLEGKALTEQSGPVIWGDVGANGQHAYHQLLHQGTRMVPADFIIAKNVQHELTEHHQHLIANCLAQSQALMAGKTLEQAQAELREAGLSAAEVETLAPHKVIAGNKPSNTLVLDKLSPASLGALIALYEHKVFVQGVIWGLNSFDQWGVELGKTLETRIYKAMQDDSKLAHLDSSTAGLIQRLGA